MLIDVSSVTPYLKSKHLISTMETFKPLVNTETLTENCTNQTMYANETKTDVLLFIYHSGDFRQLLNEALEGERPAATL